MNASDLKLNCFILFMKLLCPMWASGGVREIIATDVLIILNFGNKTVVA